MRERVLWRKIARIICLISKELGISEVRALDMFYKSRIYKMLVDPKYGFQTFSDACIFEEFLLELRGR